MSRLSSKLALVAVVVVLSVVADQATKLWAEASLATPRYPDHKVVLVVGEQHDGETLQAFLEATLTSAPQQEVAAIAARWAHRDGAPIRGGQVVNSGQEILLQQRSMVVVDGYWDFVYARNPGAAWSFLASSPETFRRTFFIGTSLLAIVLIGVFIYRAQPTQRRLTLALALVLGGAAGNLIDRIAYGYVIDFVAWHVGEHYWPTFNVADAVICVGVGLMALELIFGYQPEPGSEPKFEPESKGNAKAADKAES